MNRNKARAWARSGFLCGVLLACAFWGTCFWGAVCAAQDAAWRGPVDVAPAPGGEILYVASFDSCEILIFETCFDSLVGRIALPASPTGLVLNKSGTRLFVTCDPDAPSLLPTRPAPRVENPTLLCFDVESKKLVWEVEVGEGARSPVLAPDETHIFLCAQFGNALEMYALPRMEQSDGAIRESARCVRRIPMWREPFECAISPDGRFVAVSNLLPLSTTNEVYFIPGRATLYDVQRDEIFHVDLPNGGINVRGICFSPDGKFVYVVHSMGSYMITTGQVRGGWMNMNAVSFIDVEKRERTGTQTLDHLTFAAANPWGCACSPDGNWLVISHAGTMEVSVIDRLKMHQNFESGLFPIPATGPTPDHAGDLIPVQKRIFTSGRGPRAVRFGVELEENDEPRLYAYVANYFGDSIDRILMCDNPFLAGRSVRCGSHPPRETQARWGESLFNDATLCSEMWQSCATCHPDARTDALNWDLLNDGVGNPKNSKSMLHSHVTPPSMAVGVRADAETAVRKGIEMILFTTPNEDEAQAIDAYLRSLVPRRAPILRDETRRDAIVRGRRLFYRPDVACDVCHQKDLLYTDGSLHSVGTESWFEARPFDTPTLIECWRTAPYLHDGRYLTLFDLLRAGHGNTKSLSDDQIRDLEAFLLSL
ncbi:MAG: hypothetical protein Q4D38_10295 [Planctomycetia bacterium]|nr:hypothetical protein [Planctomycetia bacterium]